MVKDPVCGMTINQHAKVITAQYQGKTYYFCSHMCRMMFEREPEKYLKTEINQEQTP